MQELLDMKCKSQLVIGLLQSNELHHRKKIKISAEIRW